MEKNQLLIKTLRNGRILLGMMLANFSYAWWQNCLLHLTGLK